MATKLYNAGLNLILSGGLAGADIRALLVMTNTTLDTENDGVAFINQFTTLDEMDGANYVRKALSGEAVAKDDANDRAEFDADDVTWSALGNGTRAVLGLLIFKHVANDTDSIPIAFIERSTSMNPAGDDVVYQWNAEGIIQLAMA